MIYNKTNMRTDIYQTPVVEVQTISTEQPFLAASMSSDPEGYKFDDVLTDW